MYADINNQYSVYVHTQDCLFILVIYIDTCRRCHVVYSHRKLNGFFVIEMIKLSLFIITILHLFSYVDVVGLRGVLFYLSIKPLNAVLCNLLHTSERSANLCYVWCACLAEILNSYPLMSRVYFTVLHRKSKGFRNSK